MRPLLFLDIDGVLVSRWSLRQRSGLNSPFDPSCVNALNAITAEALPTIVLVSVQCARVDEVEMLRRFDSAGVKIPENFTGPAFEYAPTGLSRARNIAAWLSGCRTGDWRWHLPKVLLDDDVLGEPWIPQVKTDTETGLTMDDAFHAIQVLKEQMNAE